MNITNLINKLSKDANIHFYTFEQDDYTIIAKSHFIDIHFDDQYCKIVDSYVLPGTYLKPYLDNHLPITLSYNIDNFYDIMLEYVDNIHNDCVFLERREELDKWGKYEQINWIWSWYHRSLRYT